MNKKVLKHMRQDILNFIYLLILVNAIVAVCYGAYKFVTIRWIVGIVVGAFLLLVWYCSAEERSKYGA